MGSEMCIRDSLGAVDEHMAAEGLTFNDLFETVGGHPPLLKLLIQRRINLDTFVVMDICLGFTKMWDKQLQDPLWENLSLKVKKYKPFLSIPKDKYLKIMKDVFSDGADR